MQLSNRCPTFLHVPPAAPLCYWPGLPSPQSVMGSPLTHGLFSCEKYCTTIDRCPTFLRAQPAAPLSCWMSLARAHSQQMAWACWHHCCSTMQRSPVRRCCWHAHTSASFLTQASELCWPGTYTVNGYHAYEFYNGRVQSTACWHAHTSASCWTQARNVSVVVDCHLCVATDDGTACLL